MSYEVQKTFCSRKRDLDNLVNTGQWLMAILERINVRPRSRLVTLCRLLLDQYNHVLMLESQQNGYSIHKVALSILSISNESDLWLYCMINEFTIDDDDHCFCFHFNMHPDSFAYRTLDHSNLLFLYRFCHFSNRLSDLMFENDTHR